MTTQWIKHMVAAAGVVTCAAAQASPVQLAIGADFTHVNSSGRAVSIAVSDARSDLALSPGENFDGIDPGTSGGLIASINVLNLKGSAVGGASYQQAYLEDAFGDVYRIGAHLSAQGAGVQLDDQTGRILAVGAQGGLQLEGSRRIPGVHTNGVASVSNLRVDLENKVVYADLIGRSAAVGTAKPATDYVLLNAALWTIDSISGPTTLPLEALSSSDPAGAMQAMGFTEDWTGGSLGWRAPTAFSGLRVTQTGFDFFKNALGLLPTGRAALDWVNGGPQGWGTLTTSVRFSTQLIDTPAVPEPGSYALAAVGLAVAGMAARRRHRQAA